MSFLNMNIEGLTPPVLLELADHVRTFASQLESLANDNELKLCERRRNGNYKRSVKEASLLFSTLIENGENTDKALQKAVEKHCVSPEAVRMYVSMFAARQKRLDTIQRDRKIMRKWRAGHDVTHIAKDYAVTTRTIQRIVKSHKSI